MWLLQGYQNKDLVHYLPCGDKLLVSRLEKGHIVLADKSVSTNHASFYISNNITYLNQPSKLPSVDLCDSKSTNGTYVNSGIETNTRITPLKPHKLSHGDVIRFGRNNYWKLIHRPFVICSSQLVGHENKQRLKDVLVILGGHLVREWTEECSLLVMQDLALTAKTVCALASGAPIVTLAYLLDMVKAIKSKDSMPDIKRYVPPLKETTLNPNEVSFLPNPSRKELFTSKIFIFQLESSYKRMKYSVLLAGGVCLLLSESNYSHVVEENHMLVKSSGPEGTQSDGVIEMATELLKKKGLSVIPESDIGLAVLYNSIDKYCNPKFKINGILRSRSNQSQRSQNLMILATETEVESGPVSVNPVSRTTVLESGQSSRSKRSLPSAPLSTPSLPPPSLPPPSLPPPSLSNTSTESSLMNTEVCSALQYSPKQNCVDKENICKRKRSPSVDNKSPPSRKKHIPEVLLANTEAMNGTQDEVDEASKFSPLHFSTERDSPLRKRAPRKMQAAPPVPISPISEAPSTAKKLPVPSTGMDETSASNASFAMKSIPFEPYTLPSLCVEDASLSVAEMDVETQHFVSVKREHESQPSVAVEREDGHPPVASGRENHPDDYWFGEKADAPLSKKDAPMCKEKGDRINKDPAARAGNDRSHVPETPNEAVKTEKDEFTLPFASTRGRRGRAKLDETCDITGVEAKRIKVEASLPPPATREESRPALVSIKRRVSENEVYTQPRPSIVHQNNNSFISKQDIVKKEKTVDEMTETFERSLVVVEVVSLVRPSRRVVTKRDDGLPNFKRFVKILPNTVPNTATDEVSIMVPLPRIIGGEDLVCSASVQSRRETFLCSQPDLLRDLETRDAERREKETRGSVKPKFDSDFGLASFPRKKRGRI